MEGFGGSTCHYWRIRGGDLCHTAVAVGECVIAIATPSVQRSAQLAYLDRLGTKRMQRNNGRYSEP